MSIIQCEPCIISLHWPNARYMYVPLCMWCPYNTSIFLTRDKAPIFIKPDMSVEERKNEALLLKERHSLIEKGVARNRIKLCSSTLFVDNQPHCKIHNFQLQSCDSQTESNQTDSAPISNWQLPDSRSLKLFLINSRNINNKLIQFQNFV